MKIYSANQVADYFLSLVDPEVGDAISNLKLQKLCYYAQGLSIATRGAPLFNDEIEAWAHGPVVPPLYHKFKGYEAGAIPPNAAFDPAEFDAADRDILNDVFGFYGQYSAWKLREMTHEEAPWRSAFREGANHIISADALRAHFETEVSEDYRKSYAAKAA